MEITMGTALEIFTNPGDLEITIGQEKEGVKYSFGIFRGPGHNFKPLLTTQPFAESTEEVVEEIKTSLEAIHEVIAKSFTDKKSFPSRFLNPNGREIDQSKVLNQDLIVRILDELRKHQSAGTYRMHAPAG